MHIQLILPRVPDGVKKEMLTASEYMEYFTEGLWRRHMKGVKSNFYDGQGVTASKVDLARPSNYLAAIWRRHKFVLDAVRPVFLYILF